MARLPRLFALAALALSACASGQDGLDKLHAEIVADYPQVSHVEARFLQTERTLYLDIREAEEFAVSHIPGAVLVPPGSSPEAVLATVGDVSGRNIVVYCAVGRRSSIFADRMTPLLRDAGAVSVANLENGIFGWHADKRPLENKKGHTDKVHPYDAYWRRYVPRQDAVSYAP